MDVWRVDWRVGQMEQRSAEMRAVQSAAQWAERLVERKGNQSVALMVE